MHRLPRILTVVLAAFPPAPPRYFRPTEVELLIGDATKLKKALGWTPTVTFDELVKEMVESDIAAAKKSDKPI